MSETPSKEAMAAAEYYLETYEVAPCRDQSGKYAQKQRELAGVIDRYLALVHMERDQLQDWKDSMISVLPPMQQIGHALGVRLGDSIHDKILTGIKSLRTRIAILEQQNAAMRTALEQFAILQLNDGSCASLDFATMRIQNIARKALKEPTR